MLESYRVHKNEVAVLMQRLADVAGGLGMTSLRVDIEGARLPKLAEERFNLVVVGEFNHGKSTFVNALLGRPLLPMGITPTTATINHIVWSEQPRARAVLNDGGTEEIGIDELAAYVTLEGEHSANIRYVEIGYPVELLRERITLVDTPGVNDIHEARAEITYGYIPRADAVVFLLDGTQVLKQSERSFLRQRLLKRSRDKLLFVIGKADLLSEEELAETIAFARRHLTAMVDEPVLFAVSPRRYLEGEQQASGMAELMAFLRNYLERERGRILVDNAIGDAQRTAQYLRSSVGLKRGAMQLSVEELGERIAEVRHQLEGSKQSIRDNLQRIREESDAVKATVRHDLRQFVDGFCAALPGQIDKVDANDVKRYLQFFIQDKFKEWAEAEGDKVAELLEDLAEEIIKVTNENIHAVLDRVAAGLGPADTRVDLEVDTLKYDAGVFALGALGTTVFLFVNTFVGGLLTLAAPVLAVVLREKVGGAIKTQAKERGPEVIQRAGEAVKPRFEQIVDQFTDRLSDFVTSAGEALHRGISEVLDQAMAERGEAEQDLSAGGGALELQERQLGEIEAGLIELRSRLWTLDAAESIARASAVDDDAQAPD